MVFAPVRGDEPRPGEKPKLHDGVEAHAPGLRVDFAVPRSHEQRLKAFRPRRQRLTDRVVPDQRGGDRRELLGVVIEGVGIDAEERAHPFLGRHRDRPANDRGHRAIEHGERRRLRMPKRRRPGALAHPLSESLERHGVVRHRRLGRLARSSRSPPLLRRRHAAARLSASRAAFQFQTRSS